MKMLNFAFSELLRFPVIRLCSVDQDSLFESVEGEPVTCSEKVPRQARAGSKFRGPVEDSLFPEVLGARVPEGHLVREIARMLSEMDLDFLTRMYSHRGGVPYQPHNLLGVVLYGMTRGHRTGRELEQECIFDDRYRFLMGGQTPDDRTFDRFIERIEPYLEKHLQKILSAARGRGMAKGNEVAIDGCKVPGSSSWWKHRADSQEKPSDPDARLMNSHGRRMVGYNALAAVDTADGLIVGAELVNDQNDFHAAPVAVKAVGSQLGELPAVAIADSGFESPAGIAAVEDMGVDTVFACRDNLPECLVQNEDGHVVCPVGRVLVKRPTTKTQSDGRVYDVYRPEKGCRGCPLTKTCPFKGKSVEVPVGDDPAARFRNRERVFSQAYDGSMTRRRGAETPFAFLRRHDRFERFRGRCLKMARAEYFLWVASYNLRKILRRALEGFGHIFGAVLAAEWAKTRRWPAYKMQMPSVALKLAHPASL